MSDKHYLDEWVQCDIAGGKVLIRCCRIGKPVGDVYNVTFACKGLDGETKWKRCPRALKPDCLMVKLHEDLKPYIEKRRQERQERTTKMAASLLTYIMFRKQMKERGIEIGRT